ncbi:hypothetical protein [Streptomyces sp. NPDC055749]
MPEATPNSKGLAPIQMSPEQLAGLGLTSAPEATAPQEPVLIPADQVKPEDIGTLSIEYRDGRPVIVVNGGTAVPASLTVVDGSGHAVARYADDRLMLRDDTGVDAEEYGKQLLQSDDVFLINTGDHVFCWVGSGASIDDRGGEVRS